MIRPRPWNVLASGILLVGVSGCAGLRRQPPPPPPLGPETSPVPLSTTTQSAQTVQPTPFAEPGGGIGRFSPGRYLQIRSQPKTSTRWTDPFASRLKQHPQAELASRFPERQPIGSMQIAPPREEVETLPVALNIPVHPDDVVETAEAPRSTRRLSARSEPQVHPSRRRVSRPETPAPESDTPAEPLGPQARHTPPPIPDVPREKIAFNLFAENENENEPAADNPALIDPPVATASATETANPVSLVELPQEDDAPTAEPPPETARDLANEPDPLATAPDAADAPAPTDAPEVENTPENAPALTVETEAPKSAESPATTVTETPAADATETAPNPGAETEPAKSAESTATAVSETPATETTPNPGAETESAESGESSAIEASEAPATETTPNPGAQTAPPPFVPGAEREAAPASEPGPDPDAELFADPPPLTMNSGPGDPSLLPRPPLPSRNMIAVAPPPASDPAARRIATEIAESAPKETAKPEAKSEPPARRTLWSRIRGDDELDNDPVLRGRPRLSSPPTPRDGLVNRPLSLFPPSYYEHGPEATRDENTQQAATADQPVARPEPAKAPREPWRFRLFRRLRGK